MRARMGSIASTHGNADTPAEQAAMRHRTAHMAARTLHARRMGRAHELPLLRLGFGRRDDGGERRGDQRRQKARGESAAGEIFVLVFLCGRISSLQFVRKRSRRISARRAFDNRGAFSKDGGALPFLASAWRDGWARMNGSGNGRASGRHGGGHRHRIRDAGGLLDRPIRAGAGRLRALHHRAHLAIAAMAAEDDAAAGGAHFQHSHRAWRHDRSVLADRLERRRDRRLVHPQYRAREGRLRERDEMAGGA